MILPFVPIVFSTQDVISILTNQKTVFRTPVRNADPIATNYLEVPKHLRFIQMLPELTPGPFAPFYDDETEVTTMAENADEEEHSYLWPPFCFQQTLWVQEAWNGEHQEHSGNERQPSSSNLPVTYKASHPASTVWKPASTMPFEVARLELNISSVHVERLHSITEEEAIREGNPVDEAERTTRPDVVTWSGARNHFAVRWDEEHARSIDDSWSDNPFVWVINFEVRHITQEKP